MRTLRDVMLEMDVCGWRWCPEERRMKWVGEAPKPAPEPVKGPRSLRDLAHVANAFSDWGEDGES